MPDISLITFSGSLVTPQHDALIHEGAVGNGVFFGCNVEKMGETGLHIYHGIGIVHGREFEIEDHDISLSELPSSGTHDGRVYIHIDLTNSDEPIELITEHGSTLTPLVDNPDINETSGATDYLLATFKVSSTAISNLENVFKAAGTVSHVKTYAEDRYGDGIILQAGGTTIISGGEAGTALVANNINDTAAGTVESVHVAADNMIYFYSNCQTIGNRKQMTFSTGGNLAVPGTVSTGGKELYPITYAPATFDLHKATWKKATGLYYAEFPVSGWKWIFGLTITSWGGLNAIVVPYIVSANKIGFMTTASSFPSTSASVALRIEGVLS